MSLRWILFPRSARPVETVETLIGVLTKHHAKISSSKFKLESNGVLAVLAADLTKIGFTVERGKAAADKVSVPVLFGVNGEIEKSFNADAFHAEAGVVLEVEAGRAVSNNQFLKDLFQACAMQDAKHLVICVRNDYRGGNDFNTVRTFFETLYVSNRVHLPLTSVTVIGY